MPKHYHYYSGKKERKKQCDKKNIGKEYIGGRMIKARLKVLIEEICRFITGKVIINIYCLPTFNTDKSRRIIRISR